MKFYSYTSVDGLVGTNMAGTLNGRRLAARSLRFHQPQDGASYNTGYSTLSVLLEIEKVYMSQGFYFSFLTSFEKYDRTNHV